MKQLQIKQELKTSVQCQNIVASFYAQYIFSYSELVEASHIDMSDIQMMTDQLPEHITLEMGNLFYLGYFSPIIACLLMQKKKKIYLMFIIYLILEKDVQITNENKVNKEINRGINKIYVLSHPYVLILQLQYT